MNSLHKDGFVVFDATDQAADWASAAHQQALLISADPAIRAQNLRHGNTWFVGVDALPNDPDGSIGGIPLSGPWQDHITVPAAYHRAQLSIVYPGYPLQDGSESDGAHRFRRNRFAAHVDGLLPRGPQKRRFLEEWHGFILGLPLNETEAAPLMVWPESHLYMGAALRDAVGQQDPIDVDLTDAYQAARRDVFDKITPVRVVARPGQSMLLHRHLLHGVAPFDAGHNAPAEGRMIAYLRPMMAAGPKAWLAAD